MLRRIVTLVLLTLLGAGTVRADDDVYGWAVNELTTLAVKDPDRGVRYAAVQALGKEALPLHVVAERLDVLAAALADPEWCVRQEAAWWLRRAGARAIPLLTSVLDKGAPPARASAAWALSGLKAAVVPLLKKALADADAAVRTEALASARRMGLPDAKALADDLISHFKSASLDERYEAARLLVVLRPGDAEAAVPALSEVLDDWRTWRHGIAALLRAGPAGEKIVAAWKPKDDRQKDRIADMRMEAEEELRGPKEKPPPPDLPPLPPAEGGDDPPRAAPIVRSAVELAKAMKDPERDVRVAAAMELADVAALVEALKDRAWQVQLEAIRGLGRLHAGAEAVAPLLANPIVALSQAAADALSDMGDSAALPTARMIATGHYGVLHHALQIFEALGKVERIDLQIDIALGKILGPLLSHADENVRETAARCIALVGRLLFPPASELVRALGDDRLSVVSWAAIALGVRGESKDAVRALADPRARVRAYAAFALGWGFGEHNSIDQVPFEVRLPVLDVGETGPVPTVADLDAVLAKPAAGNEPKPRADVVAVLRRAIRSKDPAVAVRAAAQLKETEIDVREAERVMELLLPEGVRSGSPVDFDRLRSIIGSSELPACMMYLCRARATDPDRASIYADFHRISRADTLPALHWFGRVEEPDALDGWGEIWQPDDRTALGVREDFREQIHREPGPTDRDVLLPFLEDYRKDGLRLGHPLTWLLNDLVPQPEDAPLLIRVARLAEKDPTDQGWHSVRLAALRALGRLRDADSRAYLRDVSVREEPDASEVALAGLVRRGFEDARRELIERSRGNEQTLLLLLEVDPWARETLAARLTDPMAAAEALNVFHIGSENATLLGVRLRADAFLGIEAAVAAKPPGALLLGRIAWQVPGCATRRIAGKLFEALEEKGYLPAIGGDAEEQWSSDQADAAIAFLATADAPRALALVRRWAETSDEHRRAWARGALIRWPDRESAAMLVAWVKDEKPELTWPGGLARLGGPEVEAYLRAVAAAEKAKPGDSEEPAPEAPTPVWKQIGQKALAGDAKARAEFWSAQRAARYRWLHYEFDPVMHTLGRDPATLPHWLSDLDSNCCRVSDGLEQEVFEDPLDTPHLYGTEDLGVGEPLSQRARTWLTLRGGRWTWSPLLQRFVAQAD